MHVTPDQSSVKTNVTRCSSLYNTTPAAVTCSVDEDAGDNLLPQGLISAEQLRFIQFVLLGAISVVIELFGILSNSANIVTFLKIGLNDSVNVSFFALSVSDLCLLLVSFFNYLAFLLGQFDVAWSVQPVSLTLHGTTYFQLFLDTSILTTTYISVQRCCCVALPFRFKTDFTVRRSVIILSVLYTFVLACYIPMIYTQTLVEAVNPARNTTWYVLSFLPERQSVFAVFVILNRLLLSAVTQSVVMICLVILSSSLREASKFRSTLVSKPNDEQTTKGDKSNAKSGNKSNANSGSRREIQVVKSTTLVAALFVITNTPAVIISFSTRFVENFTLSKQYHNLFLVTNLFRNVFEFCSASFNIFIYLKFNTKFKNTFTSIFRVYTSGAPGKQ